MKLYINTTLDNEIEIRLVGDKGIIRTKRFAARHRQAEKLLPEIDKLLKSAKTPLKKIKTITVANQDGSFTSLRIGVVTANALAYALGVKVQPFSGKPFKAKGISIVKPAYRAEPTITKRKNR